MAPFRFSEDDWNSVLVSLANIPKWKPDYSEGARNYIEEIVTIWQALDPKRVQGTLETCEKIIYAAENLAEASYTEIGRLLMPDASTLLGGFAKSRIRAWELIRKVESRKYRNDYRNELLGELIAIWEAAGGEARTSTGQDGTTPTGPLIRYLMAVTGPVGMSLSPNSAREFVRKYRADLLKRLGAADLNEAYAAIRSIE